MTRSLRQLAALVLLLWRHFSRSAIGGRGKAIQSSGLSGRLLMRLLVLVLVANSGRTVGLVLIANSDLSQRSAGWSWTLLGFILLALFSVVYSQQGLGTAVRRVRPLQSPWLESLPVRIPTRVAMALLSTAFCVLFLIPIVWAGTPPRQRAGALLSTLELWIASVGLGLAALSALRRTLSSHRLPLFSVLSSGIAVLGFFSIFYGHLLAIALGAVPGLSLWGLAFSGKGSVPEPAHAATWILASLGLAYYVATERHGYDRIEGPPPKRVRARAERPLDLYRLERRLMVRQRALLMTAILSVLFPLVLMLMLTFSFAQLVRARALFAALGPVLTTVMFMNIGLLWVVNGSSQAGLAVIRDVAARPFLSTLPIPPSATLTAKTRLFSWLMIPSILVMALAGFIFPVDPVGFAVRWLLFAVTLWLATQGMVAIAFLVQGIGATAPGGGMGNANLENLLLTVPVAGVLLARHPLGALPSLGALVLLVAEARRAALRCVRWLDDPSLVSERTTLLWRALLGFALFISVQSLAVLLLGIGFSSAGAGTASGAYLISAAALATYTLANRSGLGRVRLRPERVGSIVLGALGGLTTGGLAIAGRPFLEEMGKRFSFEQLSLAPSGTADSLLVIGAVAMAAPLVEEVYFRGWLQSALEERLQNRSAWVVPLSAFAFASVHPASAFPVIFLLGLVAGTLYARTGALGPSIVAHAVHNAVALGSSWR